MYLPSSKFSLYTTLKKYPRFWSSNLVPACRDITKGEVSHVRFVFLGQPRFCGRSIDRQSARYSNVRRTIHYVRAVKWPWPRSCWKDLPYEVQGALVLVEFVLRSRLRWFGAAVAIRCPFSRPVLVCFGNDPSTPNEIPWTGKANRLPPHY